MNTSLEQDMDVVMQRLTEDPDDVVLVNDGLAVHREFTRREAGSVGSYDIEKALRGVFGFKTTILLPFVTRDGVWFYPKEKR